MPTTTPSFIRSAAALAACASAVVATAGAVQAAPATGGDTVYVALGDSFAAGVGLPPAANPAAIPSRCGRSAVNYAHLVAPAIGASTFRDVTCSGAVITDLTGSSSDLDGSTITPQYDALTGDTTLVTLGIGGNDIGLVALALGCVQPLPQAPTPNCGQPDASGRDAVGDRIDEFTPTYGTVIEEIRRRAPRAHIVMVGYPTAVREGGCPGVQPMAASAATYLQSKIDQLDTGMARQAALHGATFIDVSESTLAHDICAGPQSWMVGALPVSADAPVPMHPTRESHRNTADRIVEALAAPR